MQPLLQERIKSELWNASSEGNTDVYEYTDVSTNSYSLIEHVKDTKRVILQKKCFNTNNKKPNQNNLSMV